MTTPNLTKMVADPPLMESGEPATAALAVMSLPAWWVWK